MPTNILYLSNLNPIQFYKEVPDEDAQYNSRHMDDWYFSDTILPWEERVCFDQPWQQNDLIQLQMQCNYGPVNLEVYDAATDLLVDTASFQQIMANFNDPTLFIYELDLALNVYPVGTYYLKVKFGSPVVLTLKSENIILSEKHENTLLLNYSHYKMYGDLIFETGFASSIRIFATNKLKSFKSVRTSYKDQLQNPQTVRSVNSRVWNLVIGGTEGIPDYLADKLFEILGCSNLQIDGKYYVINPGAEMEPNEVENYPMRGWSIEMLQKINRSQRIFENEQSQDVFVAVMANSDSKGFGADNGSNETVIIDVQ